MSKKPNKKKTYADQTVDDKLLDLMGGKKMVATLIVVALIAIVLVALLYFAVSSNPILS